MYSLFQTFFWMQKYSVDLCIIQEIEQQCTIVTRQDTEGIIS